MPKTTVSLEQIRQLEPLYRQAVPPAFMDENRHMNVQFYLHFADGGISAFYRKVGMGERYAKADEQGNFALEQHLRYLAEVLEGDVISVHLRLIGLSAKRTHTLAFMVNDKRDQLAAIVEAVAMNVDMRRRRGCPFPSDAMSNMSALLQRHNALAWSAPVCGFMSA